MIFSAFGTIQFENTEPMTQKYFQLCFFFETIVLKVWKVSNIYTRMDENNEWKIKMPK